MSTNTIQNQLKLLGLNQSEIVIYLFLLENGATTPPIVSQRTKISRTNCYNILATLIEKGLVAKKNQNGRRAYLANDPEAILRFLEQKKEAAKTILPDLQGLYTVQKNKPRIKFYDGIDEVKDLYNESLASELVVSLGPTDLLNDLAPGFREYYLKEIADRKITFSDINYFESRNVNSPLGRGGGGLVNVDTTGQPTRLGEPFEADPALAGIANPAQIRTNILIWDNNVAFITLESPVFGTVLNNKSLAETFRLVAKTVSHGTVKYGQDKTPKLFLYTIV